MHDKKLVALGGGNGTTQIILSCQSYFSQMTAIVGTTDCGRSTGVARSIGNIPAPGDIRNTISNLAYDHERLIPRLLQHRFNGDGVPQLEGMAVGNLIIAALAQMEGSFSVAVDELQELVGCIARVVPVSDANVDLCAELEDGTITRNELETRGLNKSPIKRLFLSDEDARATEVVLDEIRTADLVVIGPGSFYTSIMATLVFGGIREALAETNGTVVYVANTTTQPGQTDTYSAFDYVTKMSEFLGSGVLDYALVNKSTHLTETVLAKYAADGIHVINPDDREMEKLNTLPFQVIVADFAESAGEKREIWNKLDTIRHDHGKIGRQLQELL